MRIRSVEWTVLTNSDAKAFESFRMKCQRKIRVIRCMILSEIPKSPHAQVSHWCSVWLDYDGLKCHIGTCGKAVRQHSRNEADAR